MTASKPNGAKLSDRLRDRLRKKVGIKPACASCGHVPDLRRGALKELHDQGLEVPENTVSSFMRGKRVSVDTLDEIEAFLNATSSVAKQ